MMNFKKYFKEITAEFGNVQSAHNRKSFITIWPPPKKFDNAINLMKSARYYEHEWIHWEKCFKSEHR